MRDVVRDRTADLENRAPRDLLQLAAIIGRDIDLGLLARGANIDGRKLLDLLEPLNSLGLLVPATGDPYTVRFAHDLARESVAESMPRSRPPLAPTGRRRTSSEHHRRR